VRERKKFPEEVRKKKASGKKGQGKPKGVSPYLYRRAHGTGKRVEGSLQKHPGDRRRQLINKTEEGMGRDKT